MTRRASAVKGGNACRRATGARISGMRSRLKQAAALAVVLALVLLPAAGAARPARKAEQRAILTAAGFDPGSTGFRTGCIRPTVRLSGSFAFVTFRFGSSSACVRYAFNGSSALRLANGRWTQIFAGSELPSCSLGVPADLTPCRPMPARDTALAYERAVLEGDAAAACSQLSASGLSALRKHLGEPVGSACATVMRVWAGEPDHGLPDDIGKLHVLSARIHVPTAVVVVGGLTGMSPATLGLRRLGARWFVDAPVG